MPTGPTYSTWAGKSPTMVFAVGVAVMAVTWIDFTWLLYCPSLGSVLTRSTVSDVPVTAALMS